MGNNSGDNMRYTKQELAEIKRIRSVFEDYLRRSTDFELVWSDKIGYVWLILTRNPRDPVDTGRCIRSAVDLCKTCLTDIAMEVVCLVESDHMPETANALEQAEIRRRWKPYIEQLPEYAYLCDEVLGNSTLPLLDYD